MTKLSQAEKTNRKWLKGQLAKMNGELFVFPDSDLVVCIVPPVPSDRGRFLRVSFAMCSDTDTFKRKRGELIAMERMLESQHFSVPGNIGTMARTAREVERMVMACEGIRDGYALGTR